MDKRVYFKRDSERKLFFRTIKNNTQAFSSNVLLAQYLKTSKSMIDKYLSGELTLPESRFFRLIETLPEIMRSRFIYSVAYKCAHWGQVKGGKVTSCKHKEIFNYGRKLAISRRKDLGNVYLGIKLTKELCEFIGAFIGDGFIGKYGTHHILQITGDTHLDYNY